jgi:kynurenine formamidase
MKRLQGVHDAKSRAWRARTAAAILAGAVLLVPGAMVRAHDDDHDRFDRDHRRGDAAADLWKSIRKARVIDLSHTWDNDSPIASVNPPYSFSLAATHANTRGTFGDGGQLSFTSEVMHWSGQHGAPSIDAIGHIGRDGKLFGGVDAAASTSNLDGIGTSGVGAHLAIDQFPQDLLINRGVLLDVARMVQGDSSPLPAVFEITAQHLRDAARRQHVQLHRGDTVFIRTGWGPYFANNPALYAGASSPGPGLDAAEFLIRIGARVVGDDTLTFEQRPPITQTPTFQVFPVHMRLIADSGIFIIENLNLEELSAARAYEFTVVTPPIKVLGGTGSALRAFALVAH